MDSKSLPANFLEVLAGISIVIKSLGLVLLAVTYFGITSSVLKAEEISKECPYEGVKLNKEALKPILEAHRLWVKNKYLRGAKRANLCKAALGNAKLQGVYLRAANLQGADLFEANLKGADLGYANLKDAVLRHSDLQGVDLRHAHLQRADLYEVNLKGANLEYAKLQEAYLVRADLQGASIEVADLQGADLGNAKLQGANLYRANLEGADLTSSRWSEETNVDFVTFNKAKITGAELTGVNLSRARLAGAIFNAAILKNTNFEGANLSFMIFINTDFRGANLQYSKLEGTLFSNAKFQNTKMLGVSVGDLKTLKMLVGTTAFPTGLVSVREGFKKSGDRDEERYLTYLIKSNEMQNVLWIEKTFTWLFFDVTSKWGNDPGRPLIILGWLIGIFSLFYIYPISRQPHPNLNSGLYLIFPAGRLIKGSIPFKKTTLSVEDQVERLHRQNIVSIMGYAIFFSILSAFHIGWRDLNVGNWIARLQPKEQVIRAGGWVRVVSGIQSLLSVYLIALWALVYFGRPFE